LRFAGFIDRHALGSVDSRGARIVQLLTIAYERPVRLKLEIALGYSDDNAVGLARGHCACTERKQGRAYGKVLHISVSPVGLGLALCYAADMDAGEPKTSTSFHD